MDHHGFCEPTGVYYASRWRYPAYAHFYARDLHRYAAGKLGDERDVVGKYALLYCGRAGHRAGAVRHINTGRFKTRSIAKNEKSLWRLDAGSSPAYVQFFHYRWHSGRRNAAALRKAKRQRKISAGYFRLIRNYYYRVWLGHPYLFGARLRPFCSSFLQGRSQPHYRLKKRTAASLPAVCDVAARLVIWAIPMVAKQSRRLRLTICMVCGRSEAGD